MRWRSAPTSSTPRDAVAPLFDQRLVGLLDPFDLDDVLVAQWPLFKALGHAPMLLMRSQFTEQLRRTTFEEMLALRRDAEGYEIEVQGSPALLDSADDVRPIADFVRDLAKWRARICEPARRPRGGRSVRRLPASAPAPARPSARA